MTTDQDRVSMCWQDALDDGSLTLRAEHLLLRLPEQAVPAASCLFFPNLINKLASRIPPTLTHANSAYFEEMLKQTHFALRAIEQLPYHHSRVTSHEIEQEWLALQEWLKEEIDHQQSSASTTTSVKNRSLSQRTSDSALLSA